MHMKPEALAKLHDARNVLAEHGYDCEDLIKCIKAAEQANEDEEAGEEPGRPALEESLERARKLGIDTSGSVTDVVLRCDAAGLFAHGSAILRESMR